MREKNNLAVGYIRRSSLNQKDNHSVDLQKEILIDFSERLGFYLPEEFIFIDDAVSAYKKRANQRPALVQMKKIVLEKEIKAVTFYDISRIDRTIYSFVSDFYYNVIENKPYLKFFSSTKTQEWLPTDLDVKLQLIIANAESNNKSRQATDAQLKDLMAETTKRPGSTVPFGYRQFDKKLIPDDNTSSIVLFIFYLYSWGHSMLNIASLLNEAKVPSPKGKGWRTSTIENILKNEVYAGHLKWNIRHQSKNDSLIESTHKAIVPHILYNSIDRTKELKSKYSKLDTPFLLSNLVYCQKCGEPLSHRNSSTKKNNVKYEYLKYQCEKCHYELDADLLHQRILENIKPQFQSTMLINRDVIIDKINYSINGLRNQLEKIEDKEQIVALNEKQVIAADLKYLFSTFRNVKLQLSNEKKEVQQSLRNLELLNNPNELDSFLMRFQGVELDKLTNPEIRLLLLYFISKVEINNEMQFKISFNENPVTLLTG